MHSRACQKRLRKKRVIIESDDRNVSRIPLSR